METDLTIVVVFQGMDKLLYMAAFFVMKESGCMVNWDFPAEQVGGGVLFHEIVPCTGQVAKTFQADMLFPFDKRCLAQHAELGEEEIQQVIQNLLHSRYR